MPRIKVTAGIVREYDWRELNAFPYCRIVRAGEYEVSARDLAELISDAEYQGDVDGCSQIEHPPGVKAMYRRFHKHLLEVKAAQSN